MTDNLMDKAKAVIRALDKLETALDDLEGVEINATVRFFGDGLAAGITGAKGRRGFYPALWGDKPRPTGQDKALQSARDSVKRLEAQLKELRGQNKRTFFHEERPPKGLDAAIERTQEHLEIAEARLAQLEGRTELVKATKLAEREAQRRSEALEYAAGIKAQQERAKARTNANK